VPPYRFLVRTDILTHLVVRTRSSEYDVGAPIGDIYGPQ
jgi:hypothetical protein